MNCPDCGARNTADAPWCTQCLRPLGEDAPETPAQTWLDTPAPVDAPTGPLPRAVTRPPATGDRSFRSVDGVVEWRCSACDAWNRLETPVCTVCGHHLGSSVTGATGAAVADRVSRARRLLWVAAGIGAVLMVVSVVLLVMALQAGASA